ncbi:HAMP domain-containing sensor histidine kinase [Sulfuricurvum sp.]|uniref:sensor histidine kinase n=1 Tax=Sulfuricurvum sp. TaxID=2025608 RepID=UPI002612A624|nr:HAMP domain-containing sensor histidine kinase [Sulfuricurvum sp.]MDD2267183.1 HAMP domain-containing sensor histidine kinase [Sulfuricurvum sp.]MDD2782768.1 HAMP domain-containing sensor histidine kinase [Sulfuricurvum sp.]
MQRRLSRISLREFHFYTIVFILLFTVIFSSLLIYDEYKGFEKTVHLETYSNNEMNITKPHALSHSAIKGRLIKIVLEISTLALILFGFIVGISKIVNSMIARDMERFLEFFESVRDRTEPIDPNDLYFSEFKKMAGYANEMASTMQEQKESLQQLNTSLEERVRLKTQALQIKNDALEAEQKFSQGLLDSHKQFIRYAIHETHTPLSVIMANIELFSMNEGRNRYLAKIEAAVKNIFSIYDDLSYLVKKDQIDYPARPVDLGEYVEKRLEFFDEVAHFSNLTFVYNRPEFSAWIMFNETKLQRVIDNNITNAIKYTKNGEEIRVGVECDTSKCLFWVESRSQKIHDSQKIFEAYYRERKKTDGFGLGLSLVKSICDEDGVEIRIVSDNELTRFEYHFKKGNGENTSA